MAAFVGVAVVSRKQPALSPPKFPALSANGTQVRHIPLNIFIHDGGDQAKMLARIFTIAISIEIGPGLKDYFLPSLETRDVWHTT